MSPRNQIGRPLTAACDNVFASRIGALAREATTPFKPDDIDAGLHLINLLAENGFDLIPNEKNKWAK